RPRIVPEADPYPLCGILRDQRSRGGDDSEQRETKIEVYKPMHQRMRRGSNMNITGRTSSLNPVGSGPKFFDADSTAHWASISKVKDPDRWRHCRPLIEPSRRIKNIT